MEQKMENPFSSYERYDNVIDICANVRRKIVY